MFTKLDIAKVNLEKAKIDATNSVRAGEEDGREREEKRKDDLAKNIAANLHKGNKGKDDAE